MGQILDNGYKLKTTFWMDFTVADAFGADAILDTFNRAFDDWKDNVIYVTELAIVMSNYSIEHHGTNEELSDLYTKLYYEVDQYCMDNLKNSALEFYIRTTD